VAQSAAAAVTLDGEQTYQPARQQGGAMQVPAVARCSPLLALGSANRQQARSGPQSLRL